ncbi:MAG: IS1182 family transposase [bacterium]|nr:IS1182 family transposase [bacterium]
MSTRFVSVDRNQPLLLPPDLRDWVPEDDLVNFVIQAVEGLSLSAFKVNVKGTGSAQFPPHMMLSLLIYCYANGIFSSRRIERATYRDIAVRYLTADTHPDHDTIATFRRENFEAVGACFLHVLELARELKLLKVGMVSVDGTKIKANANKSRGIRYDRAGELIEQLELEIRGLMEQAEAADQQEGADGQSLPDEIKRRKTLKAKLEQARRRIEERAKKKADAKRGDYEHKVKAREQRKGRAKGCHIKEPDATPRPTDQDNLTDPDSRLMRKNKRSAYEQSYNAQAAVDADGSQLVLSTHVSQCASDRNELVCAIAGIPDSLGRPKTVLADNGYLNEEQVRTLEGDGEENKMELLVSAHAEAKQLRRKHDFRPLPAEEKKAPEIRSAFVREMKEKMEREDSRAKYRLRKQTVEPVFGTVKKWMGFTQFLLRGHEKVSGEWQLVALAYNMKHLWRMQYAPM